MKTYWGSGGIALRILDFRTRWRWVVSFTLGPLYPKGKSPLYPLDRRLGGHQSRPERGGEKKNSRHLPGLEPPILQPVAQRYNTELCRLLDALLVCLFIYLFSTSFLSSLLHFFVSFLLLFDIKSDPSEPYVSLWHRYKNGWASLLFVSVWTSEPERIMLQ
jgi:hypothetical protein